MYNTGNFIQYTIIIYNGGGSGVVTKSCLTFVTQWTCTPPGSPVPGLPRQAYWSGLPFPSTGNLPDPGNDSTSPALQVILYSGKLIKSIADCNKL